MCPTIKLCWVYFDARISFSQPIYHASHDTVRAPAIHHVDTSNEGFAIPTNIGAVVTVDSASINVSTNKAKKVRIFENESRAGGDLEIAVRDAVGSNNAENGLRFRGGNCDTKANTNVWEAQVEDVRISEEVNFILVASFRKLQRGGKVCSSVCREGSPPAGV
jgi:hypothetical protein